MLKFFKTNEKNIFTREEERTRRKGGRDEGSRGSGDMESSQGCEKERGDQVGGSSGRQNGRAEII